MSPDRQTVSLVFPAFNEIESVGEIVDFARQIRARHPEYDFQLVVVDDGSSDGTADALEQLVTPDDNARIVRLSRNFGSHAAISAGFSLASGDAALTLSADRQEPIEAIDQFLAEWESGAEIVWGLRSVRATKAGAQETFATTFSKMYQRFSDVPSYPSEGPSQILVARGALDALNLMPEANRNVLAMAAWTGFEQRRIYFEQLPRPHGVSKWTSKKKIKLVVDSFVEFSHAPLQWVAVCGVVCALIGVLLLIVALILLFTPASSGSGVALIAGLVVGMGGANLVGLGVVGEYVWRAGDDARRRPVFIVSRVYDSMD